MGMDKYINEFKWVWGSVLLVLVGIATWNFIRALTGFQVNEIGGIYLPLGIAIVSMIVISIIRSTNAN